MKLTAAALLSITLVPLSAGCYDQGDREDCVGLKCPAGFQWPDGGEIRVRHIRFPDGSDLRRLSAHFIESQDPDPPLPEPAIGLCGPDLRLEQAESRQYLDVGESVTFDLGDGDYVIPRLVPDPAIQACAPGAACAEGVIDYFGRRHEVAYLLEVREPVGDGFYNASQSVTTAEPQPFSDQLTGFLQPPPMEIDAPGFDPAYGAVAFRRGQEVEFRWHQAEQYDPGVMRSVEIMFLPDAQVTPTTCIVPDDGQFTVPAEVIAGLEADTGMMLVVSVTNEATLTAEGRIINMWGQFSQSLPWARAD